MNDSKQIFRSLKKLPYIFPLKFWEEKRRRRSTPPKRRTSTSTRKTLSPLSDTIQLMDLEKLLEPEKPVLNVETDSSWPNT